MRKLNRFLLGLAACTIIVAVVLIAEGMEEVSSPKEPGIRVVVLANGERAGYYCTTYRRTFDGYALFDKNGKLLVEIFQGDSTSVIFQTFP